MGKKRRKSHSRKSNRGPDPIDAILNLAGAVTMGVYADHKIKQDFKKGQGEESLKAARAVLGAQAMRRGTAGTVGLGGLIGVNNAVKNIEKQNAQQNIQRNTKTHTYGRTHHVKPVAPKRQVRTGLWRDYCEDGSAYGLDPYDFETADDYADALDAAKNSDQ